MSPDTFFRAELSWALQVFIRTAYGVLLLGTLGITFPQSRRFFVSERYGGYAKSTPVTDRIQHPTLLPFIMGVWLLSAVMIAVGYWTVLFCLINLLICRYFFVQGRWTSILRGMGAPGFMTYWLGACVFFLEYSAAVDPGGPLRSLALLAFRLDFAAIMLSAGLYKALAGYRENEGMDLGLANPWWGYWWKRYRTLPPHHVLFKILNHLAYGTEIAAGILLLIPATQSLGAILIICSFLFIATQIRLGFLCEMVMLTALLYLDPGSWGDGFLRSFLPALWPSLGNPGMVPPVVNRILAGGLWTYIILLPFAHAGLYYNLFRGRMLPGFLQKCLELYTGFLGLMIWRVFSADVTDFFVRVTVRHTATGEVTSSPRVGASTWGNRWRYLHVGEFICLASIFTTLRYHPTRPELFHEKLLRYARTIPCPTGSVIVFEYISLVESSRGFQFVPAVEYVVDPHGQTIEEVSLDASISVRKPHRGSPVREGARPGSYAPRRPPGTASKLRGVAGDP